MNTAGRSRPERHTRRVAGWRRRPVPNPVQSDRQERRPLSRREILLTGAGAATGILGTAAVMMGASRARHDSLPRTGLVVSTGGLFVAPHGSDTGNDGLSFGAPLQTITAALDRLSAVGGGDIRLAPGRHLYGAADGTGGRSTIRLVDNVQIHGVSSGTGGGSVVVRTVDDGRPMFDSDPGQPLGGVVVEDLQITTTLTPQPHPDGTSHGFALSCLTNNSALRRILGQRLRGDVVHLSPNRGSGDTAHGMFNAELAQIFGVACGGFVVSVSGWPTGTIRMPDGTNMAGGLVRLSGGNGNQANCVIEQPMWEGGTGAASLQPILLEDMGKQPVLVLGGTFAGATGSTAVVRMAGASGSTPVLIGCTGYNFANWIEDRATSFTLPMSARTTYFYGPLQAQTLAATGPGAILDIHDTTSGEERLWRWSAAHGTLVLSQQADHESSARDVVLVEGPDARFHVVGSLEVGGGVGFFGGARVADRPEVTGSRSGNAALASLLSTLAALGLITDSSAP